MTIRPIAARFGWGLALLAACGGERTPPASDGDARARGGAAPGQAALPAWMQLDRTARRVRLEIVAAQAGAPSPFTFNGYGNGEATLTVPVGFEVTLDFRNADPATPHSVGVDAQVGQYPATFTDPRPVFAGAISAQPIVGTPAGQSETLRFLADRAGSYALVCYVAGHAVAGMWIRFDVSGEGEAGFTAAR